MTELQGGNNLYSGANPLCPTAEEIIQWLWINFATEAKGGIFWSFNARSTAAEAGEWAMINFKNIIGQTYCRSNDRKIYHRKRKNDVEHQNFEQWNFNSIQSRINVG